jgi:hypothetical protein
MTNGSHRWLLGAVAGLGLCAGVLSACKEDPLAPGGTVVFVLDAPLCSSALPVEFLIDSVLAGSDTFRIHLPPDDTISPTFRVGTGSHILGARVVSGYVWPDTAVTITPGEAFTLRLPFYCS